MPPSLTGRNKGIGSEKPFCEGVLPYPGRALFYGAWLLWQERYSVARKHMTSSKRLRLQLVLVKKSGQET